MRIRSVCHNWILTKCAEICAILARRHWKLIFLDLSNHKINVQTTIWELKFKYCMKSLQIHVHIINAEIFISLSSTNHRRCALNSNLHRPVQSMVIVVLLWRCDIGYLDALYKCWHISGGKSKQTRAKKCIKCA